MTQTGDIVINFNIAIILPTVNEMLNQLKEKKEKSKRYLEGYIERKNKEIETSSIKLEQSLTSYT